VSALARPSALVSVVLPCPDRLPLTRLCVAALARHTRPPWELVVVDDGSTDGTAEYLRGVRDAAPFPITVLTGFLPFGLSTSGMPVAPDTSTE
jgi:hypothetical protein